MADDTFNVRAGSVKRGQAAEITVTPFGVVINDENGATMHQLDGSVVTTREDGTLEMMNPRIERIEVHDLRTLVSHQVQRVVETTSHHLAFVGGGRFACLCDGTGKVIEITSRGVNFQYDRADRVMRVGTPPKDKDKTPAKPVSLRKRVARAIWEHLWIAQMKERLRKAGIEAHE